MHSHLFGVAFDKKNMKKQYLFDNGLSLILDKNSNVSTVTYSIYFSVGSLYENEKNQGISHLVEHMFFRRLNKICQKDLYFKICKQAVDLAIKIKEAAIDKGYTLLYNSFTNQQFIIVPNIRLEELEKDFVFLRWEKIDENNTAVRICTSWATTEENVDKLIEKM